MTATPSSGLREGWEELPLRAVLREQKTKNVGLVEKNLLSLSFGRIVRKDITGVDGLLPESFETYQIVDPGFIIFRFTDMQNDQRSLRSALAEERGIITSAYLATEPSRGDDSRYLAYLFRSMDTTKVFYSLGGGVRQSLKFADIARVPLKLPPLPEQRAIADYLDRETAQIDTLIEEQQRLIALGEERRIAVVASDFDRLQAPMKRLKHVAQIQTGVTLSGDRYADAEKWPYLRVANVQAGSLDLREIKEVALPSDQAEAARLRSGDVLMTEGGDLDKLGRGTVWRDEVPGAVHQNHVFAVRPQRLDPDFLSFWLDAPTARNYFRNTAKKTTNIASTNKWTLGNLPVPVPERAVQEDFVRTMQSRLDRIDDLRSSTQQFIELSRERRAALITAGVTGQIDVGAAA